LQGCQEGREGRARAQALADGSRPSVFSVNGQSLIESLATRIRHPKFGDGIEASYQFSLQNITDRLDANFGMIKDGAFTQKYLAFVARLSPEEAKYINDFIIGVARENSYKEVFTIDGSEKGVAEERDYIILVDSFAVEGDNYQFTIAGLGQFEVNRNFTDIEDKKKVGSTGYDGKKDNTVAVHFDFRADATPRFQFVLSGGAARSTTSDNRRFQIIDNFTNETIIDEVKLLSFKDNYSFLKTGVEFHLNGKDENNQRDTKNDVIFKIFANRVQEGNEFIGETTTTFASAALGVTEMGPVESLNAEYGISEDRIGVTTRIYGIDGRFVRVNGENRIEGSYSRDIGERSRARAGIALDPNGIEGNVSITSNLPFNTIVEVGSTIGANGINPGVTLGRSLAGETAFGAPARDRAETEAKDSSTGVQPSTPGSE